jgi:hypothetical protein
MRTKLKNMGHGALTRNGIALSRAAFASRLSRARLEKRDDLALADALIMQAVLRQIEALDREVEAIGAEIVRVGQGLAGVKRLLQVHSMNLLSAISLLAEIRRHRVVRDLQAVDSLRRAGDFNSAVQ